jgi:tRNA pseudouridine38-40 synthase
LVVEYDGSAYKGWQRQADQPSIQAAIESAIGQLTSESEDELAMRVAGRTDAGVHAMAQVCSVLTRWDGDRDQDQDGESTAAAAAAAEAGAGAGLLEFGRLVNTRLPLDIAIVGVEEVPLGWVPYKCFRKRYRYRIAASRYRKPPSTTTIESDAQVVGGGGGTRGKARGRSTTGLSKVAVGRQYVWQCPWALSLRSMQRGAAVLEGRHDFTSFCHASEQENDNVISVESIRVTPLRPNGTPLQLPAAADEDGEGKGEGEGEGGTWSLALDFVSHGFRMHMVRNLVGMLVDIGRHARTVEELPAVFEAKDRGSAGEGAPAHGLMLMSVHYDEDEDPFDEM